MASQEELSTLEDEGTVQIIVDCADQSLWIRVGPIFRAHNEIDDEPGIWVEYQTRHMDSDLLGPVLITAKNWDELDKIVRERIAKFDKTKYAQRS